MELFYVTGERGWCRFLQQTPLLLGQQSRKLLFSGLLSTQIERILMKPQTWYAEVNIKSYISLYMHIRVLTG